MTDQAFSFGNESVVWDPPLNPGLAASDVDSMNDKVTIEDQEELLASELTLKLPAQLKELHVRVSHVNSPSSFYVQLAQDRPQLSRSAHRTQLFELSQHLKFNKNNGFNSFLVEYFLLMICCCDFLIFTVFLECVSC